ncbi:MAG: phosphoribosylformylglycinamidine synthase subunit PurQ, partial [Paracoccaceae bacterium]
LDNPNGSMDNIAGVVSQNRRILGMMPHPERAIEDLMGSPDGKPFFAGLVTQFVSA